MFSNSYSDTCHNNTYYYPKNHSRPLNWFQSILPDILNMTALSEGIVGLTALIKNPHAISARTECLNKPAVLEGPQPLTKQPLW